jgi:hypothetical protein
MVSLVTNAQFQKERNATTMLLCDHCEQGWHMTFWTPFNDDIFKKKVGFAHGPKHYMVLGD